MNAPVVTKNKLYAIRTINSIKADASGKVPERLQIIAAGRWIGSWKGDLEITISDLEEMKANFDKGIGLPVEGAEGAPIDYKHEDWDKAAGWIKELEIENGILYASVIEWTPAAIKSITEGEYKFFSPSLYPACMGMWRDPEDPALTARNVLMGGGLTNIPFFKGLTGLRASESPEGGKRNLIYVNADIKEGDNDMPTLEEVRAKAPADLTEDDKKVLEEHKDELTADEQVAFGLIEKPADKPAEDEPPKDEEIQASLKAGTHMIVKASEYNDLKSKVDASTREIEGMRKEKVQAAVKDHVARGAIKADQAEKWVGRIMADATVEEDLKNLPSNELLASEIGKEGNVAAAQEEDLHKKTVAKLNASRESGKPLTYSQARHQVEEEENK